MLPLMLICAVFLHLSIKFASSPKDMAQQKSSHGDCYGLVTNGTHIISTLNTTRQTTEM